MSLRGALPIAVAVVLLPWRWAHATEPGGIPQQTKAGVFAGASAGVPAPGLYMFNQVFTVQANVTGPITNSIGKTTPVQGSFDVQGLLFVPGWTFLGATYDAVIAQPVSTASIGAPVNVGLTGFHNTYFAPVELSWKLGDSGFFVKSGLAVFAPDGSISGPTGNSGPGSPFWTFQPEVIVSYLKDGWNLSAAIYEEFNTANSITGYRTGDILHADLTATKTFGKWTVGPIAYYEGQVSNDRSSAFYNYALGTQRFTLLAAGGLVAYDFGPVSVAVWATEEFLAKASGATVIGGVDSSSIPKGATVLATLSYRLWAPDDDAPARPGIHK